MGKDIRQKLEESHPAQPTDIVWMREILGRPWQIAWLNFLAGMARGLGFAIGLTLLAGIVMAILFKALSHALDLPLVGQFLAEFITDVQAQMAKLEKVRP